MCKVEGIGFVRADTIAQAIGIKSDSPVRLKALINYCLLKYNLNSGNTYISINDLFLECAKFANQEEEILKRDTFLDLVDELKNEGHIIIDDDELVYIVKTYNDEYGIAKRIYALLQNNKNEYK